jgi:hypothetical protein
MIPMIPKYICDRIAIGVAIAGAVLFIAEMAYLGSAVLTIKAMLWP